VEGGKDSSYGFVGTEGWTAPEVREYKGSPQRYSAVLADLWSCGKVIQYICGMTGDISSPMLIILCLVRMFLCIARGYSRVKPGVRNYSGRRKGSEGGNSRMMSVVVRSHRFSLSPSITPSSTRPHPHPKRKKKLNTVRVPLLVLSRHLRQIP
jgi:serine/threonine protein kinase